jgi:hypothetical protein
MQLIQYPHPPPFSSKIMNNSRLKTFVIHAVQFGKARMKSR